MNHVYRIVFNRALGLCQVVSELASAHGGGAAKAVRLAPRPSLLANACLLALGMTMVGAVSAQTVIENRVLEVDSPADLAGDVTLGSNGELRGTADITLANHLTIEAATTPTISAATGTTLTLAGTANLWSGAGLAFGSAGHTGTVVISSPGFMTSGTRSALNINYGALRIGNGNFLTLLERVPSINIAAGAILDFNDMTRYSPSTSINNLQGAGTLRTGALSDAIVAITGGDFSGAIEGAGGIEKRGSGTLTLSGVNTYSGSTTISDGTFALSAGGRLAATSAVNLSGASAVFDISAATVDQSIGSLAGVAGSTITLGATTLNIGSDNSSTLHAGTISGTGALIKHGTGGLTLTGGSSYDFTSIYDGTLTIKDGGTVSNRVGHIAQPPGSNAAATVSGTGSTWANSGELVVGLQGTGALSVADGATVSSFNGVIGYTWRGNGRVTVTGTNSTWSNSDRLSVGNAGRGILTVADGGKVSVNQGSGLVEVARDTTATGTVNIGGAVGEIAVAAGTVEAGELRFGAGAGSLNFNHTDAAYIFDTKITGAGAVNQVAGTTLLTGSNSYTGGTVVSGGTLVISSDDNLGAATGGLTLDGGTLKTTAGIASARTLDLGSQGGAVDVVSGYSLVLTGVISGHALTKTGGMLLLEGNNTYTSTTILSGSLQVGSSGTTGTLGSGEVINNGQLTLNRSDALGINNAISGVGQLVQAGFGTTTLTGTNTYTGVTTVVSGILQVGDGGTTGTLGSGHVLNKAALVFNRSDALVVDNDISGIGKFTQSGSGLITLTGTNTYADTTTISAGTLQVGDGGTTGTLGSGKVINNASLVFNRSDALTVSNDISGTGALFQAGPGTTTLTGTNTYTSSTIAGIGTLVINGSVAGNVQVNTAGTLAGNGHIGGNVNVRGTLAAGNSPGTLRIAGNLALDARSTSVFELGQAEVAGGPANDLVEVGGDLTLGGTLQAQTASAGWYRLFNYGGTLSGSFDDTQVSSSHAGFTVGHHEVDTATANQVNLTVLAAGQSIQFWDGSHTTPSGLVGGAGGAGSWSSAGTTWTNDSATTNSSWAGSVAHFGGTAATVSVVGTQRFDTLQFASDGYLLTGDSLALSPASGSSATINTDAGVSATIASSLVNSGLANGLIKVGSGKLILSGANSYSGIGTQVLGGTLVVAHDSALGSHQVVVNDAAGDNATLQVNAGITLANSVFIDNNGTLDNYGVIEQAGSGFGVGSMGGATINNAAGASIRSEGYGVLLSDGGTVNNRGGEISAGSWGVHIAGATGQVNNDPSGSISGKAIGVMLREGGSVTNSAATIIGTDTDSHGIQVLGGAGTITNNAGSSITGDASGVLLGAGGTVINHGGTIVARSTTGTSRGIIFDGGVGTVINAAGGTISGQRQGVILSQGGTVSNEAGATIHGGQTALYGYKATTLSNAGTLEGDISLSDEVNQVSLFTGSRIDGDLNIGVHADSMLTLDGTGTQLFSAAVTGSTYLDGILFKKSAGSWIIDSDLTQSSTTIADGVLQIGDGGTNGAITGDVVNNATLAFNRSDDVNFAGDISGSGVLQQLGNGTLSFVGAATHTGGTIITAGRLQIGDGGSTGAFNGDVTNNATLVFNRNTLLTMAGNISGSGDVQQRGSGTTLLTGNNTYSGTTSVDAGTLVVNGSLLGTGVVSVGDGSTLAGSGTIAGDVTIHDGGTLQLMRGGTLHTAALTLGADAEITAILGLPSSTALIAVNGDLALNGSLTVLDGGGLSAGVYRLADYTGALSGAGLAVGSSDFSVQTSVATQVNLINKAGQTLQFWDGGNTGNFNNGVVDGGSGNWTASGLNWTDPDGAHNGAATPQPVFAIFQGNAGTVTIDNSHSGPVAVTGLQFTTDGYTLTGDALELTGTTAIIRVGDGALSPVSAHIAAELTGSAHLTKMDGGTLILSADNRYSGGTTISDGTLQIGNGGASGAISGDVLNNGTLAFNRSDDVNFAGNISGSGALQQRGSGTVTLSGDNRYSGGTTLTAGTLIGNASNLGSGAINIAGTATLTMQQNRDASFANLFAGSGLVNKNGNGTLNLTGDSATFTGTTHINAGTLAVNGALGGKLNVHDGATLKGTGSVGSTVVMAGGTIAPGNSIGRLNVTGDLTFAAGSTYQIEATPDGSADHIHASGAIALQGGSAMVLAADGSWSPSTTYQVLSADAGISGAFDEISTNFAFLTPTLANDGHTLSLTLARNHVLFPAVATTPNQVATSTAIENLGAGKGLYDAVVQLDEANAVSAFDQLSGEVHASVRANLIQDSRFVREAAIDRLRQREGAQDAASDLSTDGNAWGRMYGSWGRQDGDGNAARSKRSAGGIVAGSDRQFGNWNAGLMAAASHGKLDVDARRSHARVDSYQLGLYAGTTLGDALQLRSGALFGRHLIETDRTITFTGVNERNRADYHTSSVQAFGELGWKLPTREVELEPFANLAYVGMTSESFREHAGISALSARKETTDTLFSTLGVRAGSTFSAGTLQANWRVMAGWRHAFNDVTGSARLSFANDGSSGFAINGLPVADDTLAIEAGVELTLRPNLTVGAAYSGQHGDGARDHGLKANVTWVF